MPANIPEVGYPAYQKCLHIMGVLYILFTENYKYDGNTKAGFSE